MFSSKNDNWATPDDFYEKVDSIFSFSLDVCASTSNAKCSVFYTESDDGLTKPWFGTCWMNPPYSDVMSWIAKAQQVGQRDGDTVVCLVPSRTETRWWQLFVKHAQCVVHIRGRLQFRSDDDDANSNHSAPFPSSLVIFRKNPLTEDELESLSELGHVVITYHPSSVLVVEGKKKTQSDLDWEKTFMQWP